MLLDAVAAKLLIKELEYEPPLLPPLMAIVDEYTKPYPVIITIKDDNIYFNNSKLDLLGPDLKSLNHIFRRLGFVYVRNNMAFILDMDGITVCNMCNNTILYSEHIPSPRITNKYIWHITSNTCIRTDYVGNNKVYLEIPNFDAKHNVIINEDNLICVVRRYTRKQRGIDVYDENMKLLSSITDDASHNTIFFGKYIITPSHSCIQVIDPLTKKSVTIRDPFLSIRHVLHNYMVVNNSVKSDKSELINLDRLIKDEPNNGYKFDAGNIKYITQYDNYMYILLGRPSGLRSIYKINTLTDEVTEVLASDDIVCGYAIL